MQQWNWHEKLKRTPVLYGCWHPYKYLVTNVWRRFHSLFVYFRFGRLGVGKTVGLYPKLRIMGRTIAGILISCGSCEGKRTGYRLLPITVGRRSID